MKVLAYLRLISLLLAIVASSFLLPLGTALYFGESQVIPAFLIPLLASWFLALVFFIFARKLRLSLSVRAGFTVVASCWAFSSLLGALPFVISGTIPGFTDAFFESVSGFTTTGATILKEIQSLPRSVNLWRTQMHWLGGMGIVALTVAILPLLGVGGFQLIKAETTGPEKGKITPKITTTAKILWFIYIGMTVLQTVLLMLAGMDFIDAVSHTFATLGTGGFSTRNESLGAYKSPAIDWICTVFMALAGVNFSLYYIAFTGKIRDVGKNTEFKVYCAILLISSLVVAVNILPLYGTFATALRYSAFQVVSITTTTGFTTADYLYWPSFAQTILLVLMLVGGCSGSTGGSVKVVRWVILGKQVVNEMRRMLHPHGIYSIRLNGRAGRKDIVFNVAAFMFAYCIMLLITMLVAAASGADAFSSFTASLALVGNIGPGFGMVGPIENYGFFPAAAKWWFSFAMIAGRLEIYTMIIFFLPSYWKK